ncbi:MAG: cyanoglobin [Rhodobacteraceae bacterium]|nr:cyanoglobin [Paracoccaceae bacterium]
MTSSALDKLGGEGALRELVEHFYYLVETLPETEQLRVLHMDGHGFAHTRTEQFEFMSGFLGGRQYYMEKHRHMNVKDIHAHVPIRVEDAEVWLQTMDCALSELKHAGAHIDRMKATLRRVAMILVNVGKIAQ